MVPFLCNVLIIMCVECCMLNVAPGIVTLLRTIKNESGFWKTENLCQKFRIGLLKWAIDNVERLSLAKSQIPQRGFLYFSHSPFNVITGITTI